MKIPNNERRIALEERRRVADMSPAEMRRHLLTSEITQLPNRRAFEEAGLSAAVALSDVDGLKAVNDMYGYEAGNALLKAMAAVLLEAGLDCYHDKGDEFLLRGTSLEELQRGLERARKLLKARPISLEPKAGTGIHFKGADFSYGVGPSLFEAECDLKRHKAKRQASGELQRGQLCCIRETRYHQKSRSIDAPQRGYQSCQFTSAIEH